MHNHSRWGLEQCDGPSGWRYQHAGIQKANAKPSRSNASQWNIGCFGSPGVGAHVGHVHFMLFVSISFALGSIFSGIWALRPYYTMRCFTGVFHFPLHFSSRFRYQHVGIQNVSENATKMQQKREKNPKREPNTRKCFYITLCVGQKRESVGFCSRFARVLLAFCSRFARVLLAFCSRFAHKLYQNANPMHSVIWA